MTRIPKNLPEKQIMYGLIGAYVDGTLTNSDRRHFAEMLSSQKIEDIEDTFASYKGKLQGAFSDHFLNEGQRQKLLNIGSTIGTRLQSEITESKKLRFFEMKLLFKRYAIVFAVVAIVAYAVTMLLLPQTYEKFKPLDYLGWEAQAFEEDPEGRLDFPSKDIDEVAAFLAAYPNLKFRPVVLAPMKPEIEITGATVIDYEPTKVAVVMYKDKNSDDAIMHFSYRGRLSDLPQAPPGSVGSLTYRAFTSEYYNLVAWESSGEVTSFLVGRQGTKELAELAKIGSGR